jgi:hypothetical protein
MNEDTGSNALCTRRKESALKIRKEDFGNDKGQRSLKQRKEMGMNSKKLYETINFRILYFPFIQSKQRKN